MLQITCFANWHMSRADVHMYDKRCREASFALLDVNLRLGTSIVVVKWCREASIAPLNSRRKMRHMPIEATCLFAAPAALFLAMPSSTPMSLLCL